MEYYSAIKKNEITAFAVTWSNLEIVILSEISQTEKEMSYDIPYMQNLKRKDTNLSDKQKTDSWTWRTWGIARGEGIVTEFGINM